MCINCLLRGIYAATHVSATGLEPGTIWLQIQRATTAPSRHTCTDAVDLMLCSTEVAIANWDTQLYYNCFLPLFEKRVRFQSFVCEGNIFKHQQHFQIFLGKRAFTFSTLIVPVHMHFWGVTDCSDNQFFVFALPKRWPVHRRTWKLVQVPVPMRLERKRLQ